MDAQQTEGFAKGWIQAWNQRDLEAVLSHYTEDVEFQSPLVFKLLGETSGTVRGKQNLREYFRKALAAFPGDIEIELLGGHRGGDQGLHFLGGGPNVLQVNGSAIRTAPEWIHGQVARYRSGQRVRDT